MREIDTFLNEETGEIEIMTIPNYCKEYKLPLEVINECGLAFGPCDTCTNAINIKLPVYMEG
jgi:hypothetical protein